MIERAAQDNLANRKATVSDTGNLATAMGFTGTLVSLPEAVGSRLFPHCLEDNQPQFSSHYRRRGEGSAS